MILKKIVLSVLSAVLILSVGSCSTKNASKEEVTKAKYVKGRKAPEGTALSKVQKGMNDRQVRDIMGVPSDTNFYPTGKSWLPFYYGPDTSRTDWMYRGVGRIVFSRNHYSGGLKVIRVDYNPSETGSE